MGQFYKSALLVLASFSVSTAAGAAAVQQADAEISSGMQLARILAEEKTQIIQVDSLLATVVTELTRTSPEFSAMVEQYPGIDKVWVETMQPIIADQMLKRLPEYHSDLAKIIDDTMPVSHIKETVQFYLSPTGQFVLNSVTSNISFENMSKEIVNEIDETEYDISKESQKTDKDKAVRKMQTSLSIEQRKTVARFELSPAGRSLAKMLPKKNALDVAWNNKPPTPEAEALIAEAVPAAMQAYMAKIDSERTKAQ